jgi:hypothetical protein
MAPEGILLPIRTIPFTILVAFIGGNHHAGLHGIAMANRFQKIRGSANIHLKRAPRVGIAMTHQRLRSEMKYNFRLRSFQLPSELSEVGNFPFTMADLMFQP